MKPLILNFPTTTAPRHARPGIDVQASDLARMIQSEKVASFIACQHPEAPFPDHWFLYVMGRPVGGQPGKCLGCVCIYADRPLALPSLDDVVELLQDVGFDGLLQVCAEPMPMEG